MELRSINPGAAVIFGRGASAAAGADTRAAADADAAWLEALYDEDVGPYVDAVGLPADGASDRLAAIVERRDPGAAVVLLAAPLGDAAAERLVSRQLGILGSRVSGATYVGAPEAVAASLSAVDALRDLIDQPVAALDDASAGLTLVRAGAGVAGEGAAGAIRHRLIFAVTTAATYLVYFSAGQPLELTLIEPTGTRPVIRDPVRNARLPPAAFAHNTETRRSVVRLPAAAWPLVVDWSDGSATTRIERQDVSTSVLPSVAEIIARHQQAQAAQDALLSTYIVDMTMKQFFRPNVADPGYDWVTVNRVFVEGKQVEFEERDFRLMGTRGWGADRPPFPLLQAEKVLSLPLDLRLTSDYRYVLDGVSDVDGRECFVLRFDPVRSDQSLYRGAVWIDRETYLKAKVHTVQTELDPPVLSSEETQRFGRAGAIGGRDIYLLTDLVGQQNMLIVGRSLLVERKLEFRDFQLNPSSFEAEREAARSSDHIMYRDTDRGLRYLVKRDGQRVVDDRITTTAKALLIGVSVDPSYDFPLPLGGINYLNFEFLGPDSQLGVLFAGVLALINVQRPHLLGQSVDGSFDLFAIAVPGSDRTYDAQGERESDRVLTIPFSTGLNLGWRLSERTRLVANYQFRFDGYFRDRTTAEMFEPPSSTITNGVGLGVEWRRGGYAAAAAWSGHARARWDPWGGPGDYDPAHRNYSRHSLSLTKDFFSGFHKVHLNAAYYGGRRLDRFSQYQFGFFDEHRIRGVPSSGVRFSELGMFRASYAFNVFDQYRAEVSFDHAYGRDAILGRDWQRINGVGVGFLFRGPFKTLIRGDVGKSFLPDRYRKPGSVVFQIQVLKPL